MTSQRAKQNFANIIQKHGGEFLEKIPVITGNRAGVVDAGNGRIWIRFNNGQERSVLNTLAPLAFDRHILIGRLRSSPNIWRVAEVRESYVQSSNTTVRAHHEQHEFGGFDMVAVNRKQIMSATMFVSDAANFKVRVYGGLFPTPDGWQMAESTDGTAAHPDVDLSSYVPATGAKYVSVETDDTGALVINEGAVFETAELAPLENVPIVPAGNRLIGFALLYESQPELSNDDIYLPGLFMTDYAAVETGYQIDNAPADTPLDADKWGFWDVVDNALKSITQSDLVALLTSIFDAVYATIAHTHAPSHLHGLERWNGAGGQDTFDLVSVASGIDSVIINGLEQDPFFYTLSGDGTQIVLDDPLTSDSTVIAHTYLEIT